MITIKNKKHYKGKGEYVGRGSVLGNPYSHLEHSRYKIILVKNRDEAVERYEEWLNDKLENDIEVYLEFQRLVDLYKKDKELILICWCAPLRCHAEIIRNKILEYLKCQK